ncbi:MAG: class I SAM-dependent methyltransferase [Alphaproteobacteria bacterium]|nr:class I SAM-dependent methyltransferase [Alphaproteobacteria bacterium]
MVGTVAELKEKYFGGDKHPNTIFEDTVLKYLKPSDTVLDIGCGRTAPNLRRMRGKAARLIGVELVEFTPETKALPDLELHINDMANLKDIADASIDLAYCRAVMEHIDRPQECYQEMQRVLKPGGRLVFLTANIWDYASIIAMIVPNSLHPIIVNRTEGREMEDTFPTRYRTNSRTKIERLCQDSGLKIELFEYLGQYPNYFMFNRYAFLLGSKYELFLRKRPSLHWLRGWILAVVSKPG